MPPNHDELLKISECPRAAPCHAGAGLYRLDGRRRRFDRHRAAGLIHLLERRADCRDRSRAVLHLQLSRLDGDCRAVPPARRDRGRTDQVRFDMPHNMFYAHPPAQPGAVHRQGAEPAVADVRRVRLSRWPARSASDGSCSSARSAAPCRTPASRGCSSPAPTPGVAGRDGALRTPAHRLRRARLLHHLPDDAGRGPQGWR